MSELAASIAEALSAIPLLASLDGAKRLTGYLELVTAPAEAAIVREADTDRDMYFAVSGEARIMRGSLEVGRVRAGDHFGELSLIAGRPRSATLVADTELTLLRLPADRFEAMARERPALALALLRRLVADVGDWLTDMTHSVEVLLCERSLPRRTHVTVEIDGARREIRTGTPLGRLLPEHIDGELVVAGLVDRRPTSRVASISSDSRIEPLTAATWEGLRIYRRSLGLLALEAARCRYPGVALRIEHSIGFARHLSVAGVDDPASLPVFAAGLEAEMRALVAADRALREEWWTVDEARAHFADAGWRGAVDLLGTWRDATVRMMTYGAVYALHFGPAVAHTGALSGFRVIATDDALLLVHGHADSIPAERGTAVTEPPAADAADAAAVVSRRTDAMIRQHRRWLELLGTTTVGELNRACIRGDASDLIHVAEGFHEKRIGQIADAICARERRVRIVCIAGPSSSGKSTFIKRLRVQLQINGREPVGVSLDDYYLDRDATPRDADGHLDFEAFGALRADLLADHLRRLLAGEPVTTARFDFRTGRSHPEGGSTLSLERGDLLLLEGIHALNPRLLASVPEADVFRVFVCPLAQLSLDRLTRVHASDLRLLRRVVRDRHTRATGAAETITRWPLVRRGERRHIFPHQHHADEVFDASLIYELSVLKVFAESYLLEVPQEHPAYTTAFRLLRLLDRFVTLYPDHVPPTSLLREFIGDSGFEY